MSEKRYRIEITEIEGETETPIVIFEERGRGHVKLNSSQKNGISDLVVKLKDYIEVVNT